MPPGTATQVTRTAVRFPSEDGECAGLLFLPDRDSPATPLPCVCMAPGLGWVKEMALFPYAEAFARAGLAALTFDYRHYGESSGQPREHLVPSRQLEDYRNALSFLCNHPAIDAERLGLWGVSFSGGLVLQVAAYDVRVQAVVSVTPAVDVHAWIAERLPPAGRRKRARRLARERVRLYREGVHHYLPLASEDADSGSLMGAHAVPWQSRFAEHAPSFRNRITSDSLERIAEFSPGLHVERIAPTPLQIIVANQDEDVSPAHAREAFARVDGPKRLVEIDCDHYGPHAAETQAQFVDASVEWLSRWLG